MKINSLFGADGYVKTRKKESPMKDKKLREFEKEKIEFCLNCTKPKCNGECDDFMRFNHELYRRSCKGTN